MLRAVRQLRQSQRGFTLIELMIALVVGLIVSGAAVALVAAMIKSDADTVRATRLTQEMRATTEVIARDLRRARSNIDPIANIGSATQLTACDTIDTSTAGCVVYGYNCSSATLGTFNAVARVGNSVKFLSGTPAAKPACPTAGTGIQISSNAVNITGLSFQKSGNYIAVAMSGHLAYQPSVTNAVTITNPTRSITQEVFIRSACVSNSSPQCP